MRGVVEEPPPGRHPDRVEGGEALERGPGGEGQRGEEDNLERSHKVVGSNEY